MSTAPGEPIGWLPMVAESKPVAYAPHIARLRAWFVDASVILMLEVVVLVGFGVFIAAQGLTDLTVTGFLAGLLTAVFALVLPGYHPWLWSRGGQTPGLRAVGLRVVRGTDGGRVGGRQAVGRMAGYVVSVLVFCVGIAWILFDEQRRGWHDLLAGTVAVRR